MKLVLFLSFLAVTAALVTAETDWSKIKHKYVTVQPALPPPLKQPRIVGGKIADPQQFPHQVYLLIDAQFFCGGSILKANKILTAAHCVDGASLVLATAGAYNITLPETTTQTKLATAFNIRIHENYDPFSITNDIAIIHLTGSFIINNFVKTLALYTGNSALVNVEATVSGWGRTSDKSSDISDILRYATSKIISNDVCKKYYPNQPAVLSSKVVCLDGTSKKGACNGDSGGPLHIALDNQLLQAGIVSFGSAGGCEIGHPSAYTRISSYIDWINKNIS